MVADRGLVGQGRCGLFKQRYGCLDVAVPVVDPAKGVLKLRDLRMPQTRGKRLRPFQACLISVGGRPAGLLDY